MKKLYFILSLLATTFLGFAQDDANAPEIKFSTESIDYGTIKQDANGVRTFDFTNTGKAPLVISSATGSCGCTVPTYPKEPIMPGQKSKIEVRYDTHRVGPFSKTVTVNSNAKVPTATLRISGTVEAAAVEPTGEIEKPVVAPTPAPVVVPVPNNTKTTTTTVKTTPSKTTTTTKNAPAKKTTTTKKPTTTKKTTSSTTK
jgi:hypothetical protein